MTTTPALFSMQDRTPWTHLPIVIGCPPLGPLGTKVDDESTHTQAPQHSGGHPSVNGVDESGSPFVKLKELASRSPDISAAYSLILSLCPRRASQLIAYGAMRATFRLGHVVRIEGGDGR